MEIWARFRSRMERLRQNLLMDELPDDPRHAMGHNQLPPDKVEGTILCEADPCAPDGMSRLLAPSDLMVSPAKKRAWDITMAIAQVRLEARMAAHPLLWLQIELLNCSQSERACRVLETHRSAWEPHVCFLRLCPGDRRRNLPWAMLRLGDVDLTFGDFPTSVLFDIVPGGLVFKALIQAPWDARNGQKQIEDFLGGQSWLADRGESVVLVARHPGGVIEVRRSRPEGTTFTIHGFDDTALGQRDWPQSR